ncbi:adenylate kinase family protein [Actinomadura sp. HBU206391]|uniref:adenylate kinase family protein n=1 Tax=Actinomadura sp. HBU206391 TaxID=2731692 RepID=UPI001650A617|nr:nucleoside monophosphate kinase [Actinomadura sp. HBU206391]MBC6461630.1 nucleoside monophosphate kinase [Actinomadura sp. HBU206391]
MRKYVIVGVQGSGKGTQSMLLARDLGLVHIAVGAIFRRHVDDRTKLGARVRDVIAAGELVEDDVTEAVVRDRLELHDWNHGFVIDGFPRNRHQAEFFLERYDIDAVIHLDLPGDEARRRVLARRVCAECGATEHGGTAHGVAGGARCEACGGELIGRTDDTEESLAERLRLHRENIDSVLDAFRRKERVLTFDASPGVDAVQREIRRVLDLPPPSRP